MKNLSATSIVLFSVLLTSRISMAQPGNLDPTFANGGISMGNHAITAKYSKDMALTMDGKRLVLTNDYSHNFLLCFLPNGNLDSSFGINGVLQILIGEDYTLASAMAVDSLNRILVIGSYNDIFFKKVYVYRLLADGSTDETFGINGKAKVNFDYALGNLLIQPDGKILASGRTPGDSRIMRLNEDGSVDLSFSGNGWLSFDVWGNYQAAAMSLDPDNNILVTGSYDNDLYVARILPTGQFDNSFSGDGHLTFNNDGSTQRGRAIAAMPGGEIVVTGFSETHFASKINCWRFLHDGSLDASFGNNGVVNLDAGDYLNIGWFLIPNADSSVIIGGSVYNVNTNVAVLFKLLYNGTPDITFGENGISQKAFSSGRSLEVNGAQTSDGKIVLSGTELTKGNNQTAVSQFLPDGSADASFGMNGTTSIPILSSMIQFVEVGDFAVLPNGNILCASFAYNAGLSLYRLSPGGIFDTSFGQGGFLIPDMEWFAEKQFIAARDSNLYVVTCGTPFMLAYDDEITITYSYNDHSMLGILKLRTDGTMDSSYGSVGMVHPIFFPDQIGPVHAAGVQPDGKLIVAGTTDMGITWPLGSVANSYLVRFNMDGTLDLSFGDQGIVIIAISDRECNPTLSILDDGKIVVAELTEDVDFIYSNKLLRLMPDGSMDMTFGVNGIADLGYFAGGLNAVPMVVQPDNKMILAVGPLYSNKLLRVNENGIIDSTFGYNGYSNAPLYADLKSVNAIQLDQDARVLCYGTAVSSFQQQRFSVSRLNTDGTFDLTFGNGGISTCDSGSYVVTNSMHLQPDGKILISGGMSDLYVARLLIDYPTGLTNNDSDLSVLVFPNPVQDQLMMKPSFKPQQNAVLTVVNILGKIMQQHEVDLTDEVLSENVAGLTSGIYTITLKTNAEMISAKFIKE